ncbi:hypothetical protein V5279_28975 [Bradyrhizobium sp. 26S5]|uniref:hypothetical protein n=1 Tax=Bradyrhizobium sp. 26S5 TaxID=3139729 RepID=UPI0030CF8727
MSNKQFVLAALRCTALRVQLIREEINVIGVALAGEMITPEAAIEWCDDVAPGCLEVVINTSNELSEVA